MGILKASELRNYRDFNFQDAHGRPECIRTADITSWFFDSMVIKT